MDWLNFKHLLSMFLIGFESVEHPAKNGPNSLSFNYKGALSQMLVNLQKNLQRIAYKKMTKTAKSNDESSKLRAAGNKWFTSSASDAFDKALELYTKSIAFALPNSEEMALGYANRSAVFFKLNCYQECLDNIERALLNYPDHLKSKLYDRQADCYSQLTVESKIEAKVRLDKVPAKDSSRTYLFEMLRDCPEKKLQNYTIYKDCVLPEIENRSMRYPCASDAVEVQHSETFGRHVVATRDIDVGEVLTVERLYFRSLSKDNLYSHCSYCTAFLWNPVPCDECVNCVFCSEDCKEKAWIEYHDMECTVSDLISRCEWESFHLENIRLLLQMHHEAGGLQELKERVINILGNTLDACEMVVQDSWYQGATLETILCLNSHENTMVQQGEFLRAAICTFRIMFCLLTHTDFFGVKFNRDETHDVDIVKFMSENSDFAFVGRLLIKLFYVIHRNGFLSFETTDTGTRDLGTVTAGLLSLLNNSCYPNICMVFAKDHIVARARHPIKKGEQIFTCYCGSFSRREKADRQELFESYYCFTCNCVACTEDWPAQVEEREKHMINIELIWRRCQTSQEQLNELYRRVLVHGHYSDLDELLISYHKVIRAIYEEVGVNSNEMRLTLTSLNQAYSLTGNVKKYRDLSGAFTILNKF